MCGIAGVIGLTPRATVASLDCLQRMAAALRHRGPDEFGIYRDQHAGLAHARLSIIDLSTGQQPLSNEDGSLWVAFNGEIFNYLELRQELIALGHQFRTQSDTEVIVHAFEAWGDNSFLRFNGQFAIALWESRSQTLTLARDRVGVRPLYVCEHDGRLFFASEVKSIFAAEPRIPRQFDPLGIDQTFTFWTVIPPRTVFEGVREVLPGHVRRYHDGLCTERAYWTPRYPKARAEGFQGDVQQAAEAVRDALEQATRLRMLRADVPVGSYLSGGLDSSLVAALGLRAKGAQFSTFSLRFEDREFDETPYQLEMVRYLGSDHHELVVGSRQIASVFPDVIVHAERPILRTAPAPLFLLSELVHQAGIKVVLTGEGADEVFAGYDLFREAKIRRFWARQPHSAWRPQLLEELYPYLARSPVSRQAIAREFFGRNLDQWNKPGFSHQMRWRSASALKRLFSDDMQSRLQAHNAIEDFLDTLPDGFSQWSFLAQDQYLEIRTLLSGYLLSAQGDRMLMAHSIEGRFPFLDPNVVDLANSLPADFKLRVLNEKYVVKRAAQGLVPESILRRKKQPYRAPDALCFMSSQRPPWLDQCLRRTTINHAGVFDPRAVEALWVKCQRHNPQQPFSNADNMAVIGVLSTQLVYENFLARPPDLRSDITVSTVVDRLQNRDST